MPLCSIHVGVGGRGRWPLTLMRADDRFEPVALVDTHPEVLREAGREAGLDPAALYNDVAAALSAHPEAELVVVVTPSALHARFVEQAIAAGRHVLVEKPFTNSLADAKRLVSLAEAKGVCVVVSQNYRFWDVERAVQKLVRARAFGAPSYASLIHHRYRPEVRAFTMSQPMLYEMSVHHFDSLLATFGTRPVSMVARSFNPPWSAYPGPAAVSAIIEFEGPVILNYLGTFTSQNTHWSNRIECSEGALCWGTDQPLAVIRPGGKTIEPLEVPKAAKPAEAQIVDALYAYIRDGVEPEISARNNLPTMQLVDGCIASAETGRVVRFDGA